MHAFAISFVLLTAATSLAISAPSDDEQRHWSNNWNMNSLEANKRVVRSFYQEVLGDHDIDASDKYVSATTYIQHNPQVGDGLEAFKTAAREWFKDAPKTKIDIRHISAEGDLVWVHVRNVDAQTGAASSVMDIFKLKNCKIVEHWDVEQQVPTVSANPHPMF